MTRPELYARLPARAREKRLSRETRRRINQEAHRLAQEFERATRDRLTIEAIENIEVYLANERLRQK